MSYLKPAELQVAIDDLHEKEESEHFVIYFNWRNPPRGRHGKGYARSGVRGSHVISRYIEAFERLYKTVTEEPFKWSIRAGPAQRTRVYVLPVWYPYTQDDENGPFIVLPSRSLEPWLQAALHRAEIEAVHEATHAFTMSLRSYGLADFSKWEWFHEATAIYMEDLVYGGKLDSLRYAVEWVDAPERPLDHEDGKYQSGFFARYLARRFGRDLVVNVWKAGPYVEPLQAVESGGKPTSSAAPLRTAPVFGDYAHDSYFLWDSQCAGFESDVFLRFGQRALTEAFVITPPNSATSTGTVDHLACRYYRIGVARGFGVEATVEIHNAARDTDGFRCFLSVSRTDHHRGKFEELRPVAETFGLRKLSASIEAVDLTTAESVVLTIANCGTRADPESNVLYDYVDHDDRRHYRIEVRCV